MQKFPSTEATTYQRWYLNAIIDPFWTVEVGPSKPTKVSLYRGDVEDYVLSRSCEEVDVGSPKVTYDYVLSTTFEEMLTFESIYDPFGADFHPLRLVEQRNPNYWPGCNAAWQ